MKSKIFLFVILILICGNQAFARLTPEVETYFNKIRKQDPVVTITESPERFREKYWPLLQCKASIITLIPEGGSVDIKYIDFGGVLSPNAKSFHVDTIKSEAKSHKMLLEFLEEEFRATKKYHEDGGEYGAYYSVTVEFRPLTSKFDAINSVLIWLEEKEFPTLVDLHCSGINLKKLKNYPFYISGDAIVRGRDFKFIEK